MLSTIFRAYRQRTPAFRGALFYFLMFTGIGVYEPFLTAYFAQLGLNGKEIGILSAFLPLASLIAAPVISRIADRYHMHGMVLALCLAGQAFSLGTIQFPTVFLGLLPIVILYSIFRSPVQPISDSLIVRMTIRHDLDYGRLRQWGSMSFASVSLIAGIIWNQLGYKWMLYTACIVSLLVIIPALWLDPHDCVKKSSATVDDVISENSLFPIVVAATFLVGAALGIGRTFEGVYIYYLGGDERIIGTFFAISAFSEIPAMLFARRFARRISPMKVLLLAYSLMVLTYLGYSVVHRPEWMLLLVILKGLGYGLFFVTTIRLIDQLASEGLKATTQSIVAAAGWGIGPLLATMAGGVIFDWLGPSSIFRLNAILVSVAIFLIFIMRMRKNNALLGGPEH